MVYVIVYPVAVEQVGVGPPGDEGRVVGVVAYVVVPRQLHVVAHATVAPVLRVERVGRILQVARYVELTAAARHDHAYAALRRLGNELQARACQYVLAPNLGVPAVRHVENVVEPAEYGQQRVERPLAEHAEHLFLERVFRYAVVAVKPGLRSPADVQRRRNVGAGPTQYAAHLVPIGHLFVVVCLHGGSGHYHAVKLLACHILEVAVEHHHVLYRGVLRRVALQLHEAHLQLQGGVRQQPHEVGLGGYLQRHEIQYDYP